MYLEINTKPHHINILYTLKMCKIYMKKIYKTIKKINRDERNKGKKRKHKSNIMKTKSFK